MAIDPVLPVYRRSDLTIVQGEGCWLEDDAGKRYLDFASGIAVNALGHCHPHINAALHRQVDTLWHCSNLYQQPLQQKLAQRLVEATFADTVFFGSSGAEAVEAGIKMIRRHFYAKGQPQRHRIITLEGAFHGRTFAGISACGHPQAVEGYAPLLEGFDKVPFGDVAAVEAAITPNTAAILLEPIQGEGGIRVLDADYLQAIRQLCDAHGLLLFFDEVQCGMGRTGALFAYQQAGVAPDLLSAAKGIGNGFPLSALLATEHAASGMVPGSHGSTYGANPLAMTVGNAVLDVMLQPDFLHEVNARASYLRTQLQGLQDRYPDFVVDVRGAGLMLAIKLADGVDYRAFAHALRHAGLLTAPAVAKQVIRLLPPLIVSEAECDTAIDLLATQCEKEQQKEEA